MEISSSFYLHPNITDEFIEARVAELGSLSSGAKMAMKVFVKRVFTIFATNALFFARNFKFNSVKYAIYTM